jgi:hypothetical protein
MVHILENGHPICYHRATFHCQFSTRRAAFDAILILERRFPRSTFSIGRGPCPTNKQEG